MARLMLPRMLAALIVAGAWGAWSIGGEVVDLSSHSAAAAPASSPIAPLILTHADVRRVRNFGAIDLGPSAAWSDGAYDFVDDGIGNSAILSVSYSRTRSSSWLYQPAWRYPFWGYPRFYGFGPYYRFGPYFSYGYGFPYAPFYRPYFPYGYGAWPGAWPYSGFGFRPVFYAPAFFPAVPAVYPGSWYW